MKIGEFSRHFDLSSETVRFYINKGLLVPISRNSRYNFSDQDMSDMEQILKLKSLRFSLADIHRIISLKRLSNLDSAEELRDYINILKKQKKLLTREKHELEAIISSLQYEIVTAAGKHTGAPPRISGVPLAFLSYLACPHCQDKLSVKNCHIEQEQIISGVLTCACGYTAAIQNGIVMGEQGEVSIYDGPDLERNCYRMMSPDLITLMQKDYLWMLDRLGQCETKGKLILEDFINDYCFCHANFEFLDPNAFYILSDKFPQIVSMYKGLIDRMNLPHQILYIAAGSHLLPLKEGCVDIYIDLACNEYAIFKPGYSTDPLARHFHSGTKAVGSFWYMDHRCATWRELQKQYPENWEHNFDLPYFKKHLSERWREIKKLEDIGFITDPGEEDSFSYHVNDDKLFLLSYFASGLNQDR